VSDILARLSSQQFADTLNREATCHDHFSETRAVLAEAARRIAAPHEITQAMVDRAKAFMLEPVREHSDSGDPWVRALLDAAVNGVR